MESDEENVKPTQANEKQSLSQRLRKVGIEVNEIDFEDSEVKAALIQLVHEDYTKRQVNSGSSLSIKEKSVIL